jgi:hypothetical protein
MIANESPAPRGNAANQATINQELSTPTPSQSFWEASRRPFRPSHAIGLLAPLWRVLAALAAVAGVF